MPHQLGEHRIVIGRRSSRRDFVYQPSLAGTGTSLPAALERLAKDNEAIQETRGENRVGVMVKVHLHAIAQEPHGNAVNVLIGQLQREFHRKVESGFIVRFAAGVRGQDSTRTRRLRNERSISPASPATRSILERSERMLSSSLRRDGLDVFRLRRFRDCLALHPSLEPSEI
jgi:hypothetical protein